MDNTTLFFPKMLSLQQKGKPTPHTRFCVLIVSTTNCLFFLTLIMSGNHPFWATILKYRQGQAGEDERMEYWTCTGYLFKDRWAESSCASPTGACRYRALLELHWETFTFPMRLHCIINSLSSYFWHQYITPDCSGKSKSLVTQRYRIRRYWNSISIFKREIARKS